MNTNRSVVITIAATICGGLMTFAASPASAAWCANGKWSNATGRGACSWNGGVSDWADPSRPYSKKNPGGFYNDYGSGSSSPYGSNGRRGSSNGYGSLGGNSLSGSLYGNSFGWN